jgi:hypothetical protein
MAFFQIGLLREGANGCNNALGYIEGQRVLGVDIANNGESEASRNSMGQQTSGG